MRANCVICSDFFDETNPISAAPCGHVYHTSCLSLWVDQSKTCPQCRAPISKKANIQRLYFNFPPLSVTNTSELENEVISLKAQLSAKNVELKKCRKEKEDTVAFVRAAEEKASDLQQVVYQNQSEITELKLRAKSVVKMEAKLLKLEQMNVALMNDLEHMNHVQTIVQGTQKDVEQILDGYGSESTSSKQLATYCVCLKRELQKVIESKDKLTQMNAKLKHENGLFVAKVKLYEEALSVTGDKTSLSSQKKAPSFNFEFNNSLTNTPTTSAHSKPADDLTMDISPLTVPFNKPNKFNVCIKSSSNIKYNTSSATSSNSKLLSAPSLAMKNNENDSIIRSGYNGLGGHSKFNVSHAAKKIKPLKRKA